MFFFVQIVVCLCCVQSVAPAGCTGGSCYFIACGSSGLSLWMSCLFRVTMEKTFLEAPRAAGVLEIPDLGYQSGDFTLQKM